jgi:hypothetical protein
MMSFSASRCLLVKEVGQNHLKLRAVAEMEVQQDQSNHDPTRMCQRTIAKGSDCLLNVTKQQQIGTLRKI